MRISDWSSDVCSSDLPERSGRGMAGRGRSRSIGNTRHVRPSVLQSPAQHPIWRGMSANERSGLPVWHGTTILSVRKNGQVVVAGDGQVSMGHTVMKPNGKKIGRRTGRERGGRY